MPDAGLQPPMIAESQDPFATLRVINLVACLPRSVPVALRTITDRLNATHLDWLVSERVVADALVQLQANWMTDYRNSSGIVIDDGPTGAVVTIEDSAKVDPWIVRQATREATACREILLDFSRRERPTGDG